MLARRDQLLAPQAQAFGALAEGFFLRSSSGSGFLPFAVFMPLAATVAQTTTHVRPGRVCGNTVRPTKHSAALQAEPQFVEASPERVHVRDMEDEPTSRRPAYPAPN
jgi:hypothetical protein